MVKGRIYRQRSNSKRRNSKRQLRNSKRQMRNSKRRNSKRQLRNSKRRNSKRRNSKRRNSKRRSKSKRQNLSRKKYHLRGGLPTEDTLTDRLAERQADIWDTLLGSQRKGNTAIFGVLDTYRDSEGAPCTVFVKQDTGGLGEIAYRQPLSYIGDLGILLGEDIDVDNIQFVFVFFNEIVGKMHQLTRKYLHEYVSRPADGYPPSIIFPSINDLFRINSKIYLKTLKDRGYISRDTLILQPIDENGVKIDFTSEETKGRLKDTIRKLYTSYRIGNLKMKRRWSNGEAIIKTGYSGNSSCVTRIPFDINYSWKRGLSEIPQLEPPQDDYIYWLALYLVIEGATVTDQGKVILPHFLKCLGFTQTLIIDRYNPALISLGEFRTFVVNRQILGITHTKTGGFRYALLYLDETKEPPSLTYLPKGLETLKNIILKSGFKRYIKPSIILDMNNTDDESTSLEATKTFMNSLLVDAQRLIDGASDACGLVCNRFDLCISHHSIQEDNTLNNEGVPIDPETGLPELKMTINEIEDMTYGEASVLGFGFHGIDMKAKQYHYLFEHFPHIVERLSEETEAFKREFDVRQTSLLAGSLEDGNEGDYDSDDSDDEL